MAGLGDGGGELAENVRGTVVVPNFEQAYILRQHEQDAAQESALLSEDVKALSQSIGEHMKKAFAAFKRPGRDLHAFLKTLKRDHIGQHVVRLAKEQQALAERKKLVDEVRDITLDSMYNTLINTILMYSAFIILGLAIIGICLTVLFFRASTYQVADAYYVDAEPAQVCPSFSSAMTEVLKAGDLQTQHTCVAEDSATLITFIVQGYSSQGSAAQGLQQLNDEATLTQLATALGGTVSSVGSCAYDLCDPHKVPNGPTTWSLEKKLAGFAAMALGTIAVLVPAFKIFVRVAQYMKWRVADKCKCSWCCRRTGQQGELEVPDSLAPNLDFAVLHTFQALRDARSFYTTIANASFTTPEDRDEQLQLIAAARENIELIKRLITFLVKERRPPARVATSAAAPPATATR